MSSLTINSRSGRDRFVKAPLVAALIAASPALYAQQGGLEEVVVTAQKTGTESSGRAHQYRNHEHSEDCRTGYSGF